MKLLRRPGFDILLLLILAVAGFSVFYFRLSHGITNWDDPDFLQNKSILTFDLAGIFKQTTLGHYYPLTILFLALENLLFGSNYFLFHLAALGLHIVCAWCLSEFALRVLKLPWLLALVGGLMFLFHPAAAEAVAWLAAVNHLLMLAFLWTLVFLYQWYLQKPQAWKYLLVTSFYLLGLLTKELILVFPLLALAMDWVHRRPLRRQVWLEKIPWFLAGAFMAVLTWRLNAQSSSSAEQIHLLSLGERLLWAIKGVVFYVSQYFWPVGMVPFYDIQHVQVEPWRYVLCLAVVGVLLGGFYHLRDRREQRGWYVFGILFFAFNLFPNLKIIPFGEYSIFNDRYLYISGAGLVISLMILVDSLRPALRVSAISLFFAAAMAAIAPLRQCLSYWENGEVLMKTILAHYPQTVMALNNLGHLYKERGADDLALEYFQKAIAVQPAMAQAHYNSGIILQRRGRYLEAEKSYSAAIAASPRYVTAYVNLAAVYMDLKDLDRARKVLEDALKYPPPVPELYFNLAMVHYYQGRKTEAAEYLRRALLLDEHFAPAIQFLEKMKSE